MRPDVFQVPLLSIRQSATSSACIDARGKLWAWSNRDHSVGEGKLNLPIHPCVFEPTCYSNVSHVSLGADFMLLITEEQPQLPKPHEQ
jgi:hypothetical protein